MFVEEGSEIIDVGTVSASENGTPQPFFIRDGNGNKIHDGCVFKGTVQISAAW